MRREGISAAGNWIVDRVKTVDRLPGRGMLVNILDETRATGGAPANVLADLARLEVDIPLSGWGLIGDDADGALIRQTFERLKVDLRGVTTCPTAPTAYTDVMSDAAGRERMFFHHRGANARFAPAQVDIPTLTCRIFHLGYLLLLDAMDAEDPDYGTVAARLLADLRKAGIRTSVDVVSEEGDRFSRIVPPALRQCDYAIVNEIEAGRIVGLSPRRPDGRLDPDALARILERIAARGELSLVVIHMAEGAVWRDAAGRVGGEGSVDVPAGFIAGAVGAGDAFCAGVLYGLHADWPPQRCVQFGNACAIAALSAPGATEGLRPIDEVWALAAQYPTMPSPLERDRA